MMEIFRPGGLELTKKAADMIGLKAGDRVLDIGCGLGASLLMLRDNYGAEVFGADIEAGTVKKAAAKLGEGRVFLADACSLPFENDSFDAVFMECVLTLTDDPESALKEAVRVLRPGGNIMISALSGAEAGLCENGRLCTEGLKAAIKALGMEILSLSDETAALRRFVAEVIFEYDSIESYIAKANAELGGSVLSRNVPMKGTGYILLTARKT